MVAEPDSDPLKGKYNMPTLKLSTLGYLSIGALVFTAAHASAQSCADELPKIKAQIESMPGNADKNLAEHQYEQAQERMSAGKEKSCLRYAESARAAIEAWQMHDDD